ncbi:hypothetical protein [Streptomyces sp. NBC_00233]|uniref:hypothetical protein n=1 Tax=Streptomyces sp. NBC_00233 TaxID=2975686 RepID=UPI0022597F7B|nr:hypothetical protein [Streptomyces sp. NBC_00233]MCX5231304.1 hypothetical protein [Streptomyces sp. NBC_00233]
MTYTLPGGRLSVQGMVFGHLNPGPPTSFDNGITAGAFTYDRARGFVHAETIAQGTRRLTTNLDRKTRATGPVHSAWGTDLSSR